MTDMLNKVMVDFATSVMDASAADVYKDDDDDDRCFLKKMFGAHICDKCDDVCPPNDHRCAL